MSSVASPQKLDHMHYLALQQNIDKGLELQEVVQHLVEGDIVEGVVAEEDIAEEDIAEDDKVEDDKVEEDKVEVGIVE